MLTAVSLSIVESFFIIKGGRMNISAGVDSLNAFSKERNIYLYGNIRDASKSSVFDEREAVIHALFSCFGLAPHLLRSC